MEIVKGGKTISRVKFTSNNKKIQAQMKKANELSLTALGMAAASHVKLMTPVDTGALRDSIDYKVDEDGVYVGSTLASESYPFYIEKGTSRTPAQPYLQPGIMNNIKNLEQVFKMQYSKAMKG